MFEGLGEFVTDLVISTLANVEAVFDAETPFTIQAVFDNKFKEIDPSTRLKVYTTGPVLSVSLADFPSPPVEDQKVTVKNVLYSIREIKPDGNGGAKLVLREE